jgi:hypothetical protein
MDRGVIQIAFDKRWGIKESRVKARSKINILKVLGTFLIKKIRGSEKNNRKIYLGKKPNVSIQIVFWILIISFILEVDKTKKSGLETIVFKLGIGEEKRGWIF